MNTGMYQGSPGILNGYPGLLGSGSPQYQPSSYYGPRSNVVSILFEAKDLHYFVQKESWLHGCEPDDSFCFFKCHLRKVW